MSTAPQRPRRRARLRQWLSQAAPYGGALLLLAGLVRSGISDSLDLLLNDSAMNVQPATSAKGMPFRIVGSDEGSAPSMARQSTMTLATATECI